MTTIFDPSQEPEDRIARYEADRVIANERTERDERGSTPLKWNTGTCANDKRPHLENEYHVCHNWERGGTPAAQPDALFDNWLEWKRRIIELMRNYECTTSMRVMLSELMEDMTPQRGVSATGKTPQPVLTRKQTIDAAIIKAATEEMGFRETLEFVFEAGRALLPNAAEPPAERTEAQERAEFEEKCPDCGSPIRGERRCTACYLQGEGRSVMHGAAMDVCENPWHSAPPAEPATTQPSANCYPMGAAWKVNQEGRPNTEAQEASPQEAREWLRVNPLELSAPIADCDFDEIVDKISTYAADEHKLRLAAEQERDQFKSALHNRNEYIIFQTKQLAAAESRLAQIEKERKEWMEKWAEKVRALAPVEAERKL